MSGAPELDDLARRLVDLADSAGPWDDPLPEVHRRLAEPSTESTSAGLPVFRPPTRVRRPRGWLRSVDLEKLMAVAAVVALVAGLGWVIHTGGGSSASKSASKASVFTSAASAAGATSGSRAAQGQPVPGPVSVCGWPAPTSAVTVRAPARVKHTASFVVRVRLTGRAAADVYAPLVVAVQNGRVVGRLVPTVIPPGPGLRPSAPTVVSTDVTGTLRRSTCAQATAQAHGPQLPRGLALPPGRYQLIAVATASGAATSPGTGPTITAVSAPVAVTVIR